MSSDDFILSLIAPPGDVALPDRLDISHISGRILTLGQCYRNKQEQHMFRNSVAEVREFLDYQYENNHLVWNLSFSEPLGQEFDRIVHVPGDPHYFPFSIEKVLEVVQSMAGWLKLGPSHVVVTHCLDGNLKSGVYIACLLRYCGLFSSTIESFEYFLDQKPKSPFSILRSVQRFLAYFDEALVDHFPNRCPIRLKHLIINTIPETKPNSDFWMEIHENDRLVYSGVVQSMGLGTVDHASGVFPLFSDRLDNANVDAAEIHQDRFNIVFHFKGAMQLLGNVYFRIYCRTRVDNVCLLGCFLHTGWIEPGVLRLRLRDLDNHVGHLKSVFSKDFFVDLVFSEAGCSTDLDVVIQKFRNRMMEDELQTLSRLLNVQGNQGMIEILESQGVARLVSTVALQISNNNLHQAHELMWKFKQSEFYEQFAWKEPDLSELPVHESVSIKDTAQEYPNKVETDHESVSTQKSTPEISSDAETAQEQPLNKSIPPPPPPPPESFACPYSRPGKKVRNALHWNEFRDNTLLQDSVWTEPSMQTIELEFDTDSFENLFCVDAGQTLPSKSKAPQPPSTLILDLRRANNISIVCSLLGKRFTDEQIFLAIVNRTGELTLDDLTRIRSALPLEKEQIQMQQLRSTSNVSTQNRAVRFLMQMSLEPHISYMVEALIFEYQFDSEHSALMKQAMNMQKILDLLRTDAKIKILLKGILDLGNMATRGYGRPDKKALGFKMESLLKLKDVKSGDGKFTLIHYLVDSLETLYSEVLELPSTVGKELSGSRSIDSALVEGSIQDLERGMQKLVNGPKNEHPDSWIHSFRRKMEPWIQSVANKMTHLKEQWSAAKKSWELTCGYFGGDPKAGKPEEFMEIWDNFLKKLDESRRENDARKLALCMPLKKG